jgi:hypothetical protein
VSLKIVKRFLWANGILETALKKREFPKKKKFGSFQTHRTTRNDILGSTSKKERGKRKQSTVGAHYLLVDHIQQVLPSWQGHMPVNLGRQAYSSQPYAIGWCGCHLSSVVASPAACHGIVTR